MSKIYIFSGLGVDKRVFDNIDLNDLNVEFIDWIKPFENEPIKNYSKRISEKITSKNPIIIGLSFGGMIAVEISKILQTRKIILIASAKNRNQLPKIYHLAGRLKLTKLIPNSLLKKQNFITNWFFGLEKKSEKQLLAIILKDTDPNFLGWAINEIATWNNEFEPNNCIHIHGSKDRIIPIKNVKANFVIENGGHFMTVNRSKEIEKIIKQIVD